MKNRKTTGFTLIELIVVIAIISLLSTIILFNLLTTKQKGEDTAEIRTIQEIRSALHLYYSDKGYYPLTSSYQTDLVSSKYISSINTTDVKYYSLPSGCNNSTTLCNSYHLGIVLKSTDNTILNNDKDSSNGFAGKSIDCGSVSGTIDGCYDIEP